MFSWPDYTLNEAEKDFERLDINSINNINLDAEFEALRSNLLSARDDIYDEYGLDAGIGQYEKYEHDLELGLALYESLKGKIEPRDISKDDIWRYLSIKVVPDIIHPRWGLNADHYYRMSRRIYLKQLWWYIHLSWNTDTHTTRNLLKNNSTDTILNLVERPGLGYNVELYREIMKQYADYSDLSRQILRQVLILNTARRKVISPELTDGGIPGYVRSLFDTVTSS